MADGGVEVGCGDGVFDNRGSGFVGLAVDLSATDAAAGDEVGEGFREVVASDGGGDFWSASKLGGDDDEGGVEESLAVEVFEECGEGPVDDRDGGFHLFEVVIVPVVSAHFDIDVADAAFDEATGKEDSFGEVFSAVAFVDLFGFLGKVEGFEVFAVHEGDRFFEDLIVGPDVLLAGVVFGVELLVEESAEGELAVEFLFAGSLESGDVLQSGLGVADGERGDVRLHESGAGVSVAGVDGDERREGWVDASGKFGDPGSGGGMDDGGTLSVAGAHEVASLGVGTLGRSHGVDERELFGVLGELLEAVTEAHAVGFGGDGFDWAGIVGAGVWFRVKGIEVGHAAGHEEVDDAFGFASAGGRDVGVGGEGAGAEEVCGGAPDGQTEAGPGGAGHEAAAGEFVELEMGHAGRWSEWED